ncbi:hypothetical protein BDY24DRAFT_414910 [Mrakia frigida]|uniref:uncharacterized protein n=1 Tax=Mrakia frigida TaxID=29902 RepID=UPI003FCBFE5B
MTSSSQIPTHILLSTHSFPSSHSSFSASSSSTFSSPSSISYHFTSDGPFDPLLHLVSEGKRVLVWDTKAGEVTSLSEEVMVVAEGGVRKEGGGNEREGEEEQGVWIVELQEGPVSLEEEEEGDSGASIEELLEVLKEQEELIAKFGVEATEEGDQEGEEGGQRS